MNDLHGPAKNGVKSYMKSHSRSRNATSESYRYLIIKNGQNIEVAKWPFEGRSRATKIKMLRNELDGLANMSQNHCGISISSIF